MRKSHLAILLLFCLSAMTAKAQSDFIATDSGLKYLIAKPGNDKHPAAGCRVWLTYRGWLDDGTIFGSTDETLGTVAATANGKTIASGSKVDYGTEVTLTATPVAHYHFHGWNDAYSYS
jgi:hypothetical protein